MNSLFCFSTGDEPEDAEIEAPKIYESIGTFDSLKERLKLFMSSYNEAIRGGRLDLVFFRVSWFSASLLNLSEPSTTLFGLLHLTFISGVRALNRRF